MGNTTAGAACNDMWPDVVLNRTDSDDSRTISGLVSSRRSDLPAELGSMPGRCLPCRPRLLQLPSSQMGACGTVTHTRNHPLFSSRVLPKNSNFLILPNTKLHSSIKFESVRTRSAGGYRECFGCTRHASCVDSKPKKKRRNRAWRTDRTCAATRRRAGLNHLSQCLRHWLPARDNQASGPGDKPFSSLQSLHCTSQDMRSEKHCTSPSLLRTTHQSESVGQLGQSTTSIESPNFKNPNPMLRLIQHHLTLLHASSRGNDRIGSSSDLLDSGCWVPRSLEVHHQWCTGGQRGAHP